MKIGTYNVNGIRAAIKKGLLDWIKSNDYDVLCFQETKSQPEQVDLSELTDLGYHAYWHSAQKKGYSGVLTISKEEALEVREGIGLDTYDSEGRILFTKFSNFSVMNCYFPSGSSGDDRHAFKEDFLRDTLPLFQEALAKEKNLFVLGDYNIVHLDKDIHNPQRKDNPSGFRPWERSWLNDWFESDFDDAFRTKYPDEEDVFSWWSYRAGSRGKNKGWRIDYISNSKNLSDRIIDAGHDSLAMHSDHCPVWAEYKDL